jgi:hypothetical protein
LQLTANLRLAASPCPIQAPLWCSDEMDSGDAVRAVAHIRLTSSLVGDRFHGRRRSHFQKRGQGVVRMREFQPMLAQLLVRLTLGSAPPAGGNYGAACVAVFIVRRHFLSERYSALSDTVQSPHAPTDIERIGFPVAAVIAPVIANSATQPVARPCFGRGGRRFHTIDESPGGSLPSRSD